MDARRGQWMLDCSDNQNRAWTVPLFSELEDFSYEVIEPVKK